jgi:hypothetical protein
MACSLSYELAYNLKKLERFDEATKYFLKSNDFAEQNNHLFSQMNALKEAMDCCINTSRSVDSHS